MSSLPRLGLRIAGAGLLAASGVIHLDLYLTGYRSIPTIGGLFLLQVSGVLAAAVAVFATGSRIIAAAGAGLALATLGGYLQSVWIGLFGFKEIRTTAGIAAGVIEIAAFATLAAFAATPGAAGQHAEHGGGRLRTWTRFGIPGAGQAIVGVSAVALAVFGISLAAVNGKTPTSGNEVLKTTTIGGVKVLTNGKGLTLYWFAPDTSLTSKCYGVCVGYWPPVTGTPSAAPGVTGELGTIKRSDGTTQITYNGHPLYTYVGDTAPGQAFGNNLNVNGGLWHEVTAS